MSSKVILDAVKVNEMRYTMTDIEIRKELSTSTLNINNQCGSRKKNNIPFVQRNKGKKTGIPMPEKKKEISYRMTEKHPVQIISNYWDIEGSKDIVRIGENFHPFISTLIK